ncbi:putative Ig domain-containing protein, partial [Oscillatoria salina]|uniref:putative Ig domain-containing protein n=1 Tax=Oscillatoria salina TaxID=331517 RepID=UPI001CCA036C
MVIDPQTGTISWQPTPNQIGTHQVTIQLSDHLGLSTTQEFTLEVKGINTPPQIHSTPITSTSIDQAYTYQIAATDSDNDPLTYTLTSAPDNLTINQLGQINWTPQLTQIGNHEITVMVSDTVGATTTQTYNLIVQSTPINHPPTITSTPIQRVDTNST